MTTPHDYRHAAIMTLTHTLLSCLLRDQCSHWEPHALVTVSKCRHRIG